MEEDKTSRTDLQADDENILHHQLKCTVEINVAGRAVVSRRIIDIIIKVNIRTFFEIFIRRTGTKPGFANFDHVSQVDVTITVEQVVSLALGFVRRVFVV